MMENRLHDLPPLKRFKFQQNNEKLEENPGRNLADSSCLPAKKRKESRDSSSFSPNSSSASICLPAKKRVWAFQPFDIDLNVEYNPVSDVEPQKKTPDPSFHLKESEVQNEEEKIETLENKNEIADNDDDDGIVCAICESTDGDPSDPIVLCDGCDLMVHTTCYGHPFTNGVPDGDWFCDQCLASSESASKAEDSIKFKPFSCCLCPVKGGALKPTNDGRWAHVVCSVYVPEVFFEDPVGRRGIDVSKVPNRRWKQRCYLCKSKKGCAIDCSELKCPLAFHVTCGLKEDLCIEYSEGKNKAAIVAGFCRSHTDLWMKQQQTGKFKIVAGDKHAS
ncbi:hypothetical protein M9H77_21590 [Catharanthus roseus]|uniref:Uncharacterized protein n=1 Tax=Catharanthus roseus TaxID=4058 RepID=A0ACC0AQK4_CATRO|nr:hypothetical protein M9H77_21590 [Catharanthus roseus]